MDDLQAAFLADLPRRIQNLRENLTQLRLAPNEPEAIRKLFRQLHTFKGSAAAYGFERASRVAHELENLVEIINAENLNQIVVVLNEGVGEIEAAFSNKDVSDKSSPEFQNRQAIYQNAQQNKVESDEPEVLPFDLERRLKPTEIKNLRQALKRRSALAIISAQFAPADFAVDFCAVQSRLKSVGEVAATLPGTEDASPTEINLRLIFVGDADEEKLKEILPPTATIAEFFQKKSREAVNGAAKIKLSNLCRAAVLAGRQTAEAQGKTVDFKTLGIEDAGELEQVQAEACEIALLHLTRNAVAHGIEPVGERMKQGKNGNGEIRLEAWRDLQSFCLQISDDGRGLEIEKICRRAKENGLFGENKLLNERDAEQIIFFSGFSTAEKVTGEAGRGVGLDAVKTAIHEAGGIIEVSSEPARGTRFLIRFPLKPENHNDQSK